jgi:hypothetical protein
LGGSSDGNGNNCVVSAARQEKAVKQRLVVAAEHFNRDHRKGLQYLQVRLASHQIKQPKGVDVPFPSIIVHVQECMTKFVQGLF